MSEKKGTLSRFYQYQKVRFPVLGHGILIGSFTFSAMAFSVVCMQLHKEVKLFDSIDFFKAFFNTFSIFLLLRISDEFKDAEYDKQHRPHLPVPTGLVSLDELKVLGISVLVILTIFNVFFSSTQLIVYFFVMLYLFLMFKEFFAHDFLSRKQLLYVISHMMIIPLVDTLAASFAWQGAKPDTTGLIWFFAISFFNGLTLELGRKIKSPEAEEANSYSLMLGFKRTMQLLRWVLTATLLLCLGASYYADLKWFHYAIFVAAYAVCMVFSLIFERKRSASNASLMEKLSGLWAVLMYLNLGSSIFYG